MKFILIFLFTNLFLQISTVSQNPSFISHEKKSELQKILEKFEKTNGQQKQEDISGSKNKETKIEQKIEEDFVKYIITTPGFYGNISSSNFTINVNKDNFEIRIRGLSKEKKVKPDDLKSMSKDEKYKTLKNPNTYYDDYHKDISHGTLYRTIVYLDHNLRARAIPVIRKEPLPNKSFKITVQFDKEAFDIPQIRKPNNFYGV